MLYTPTQESLPLVILDLDETLIHSCPDWIGRRHDFLAGDSMIFIRPNAIRVIRALLSNYKVAVWTASYGEYTSDIIKYLFGVKDGLEFIWDRRSCQVCQHPDGYEYFAKNLDLLNQAGWAEGSYCIIDDRPECLIGESSYIIDVKPYFGSSTDNELLQLLERIDKCITKP